MINITLPTAGGNYSTQNEAQTRRIITQAFASVPAAAGAAPYLIPKGLVGDGVADDTVAIQAAINSGLPIYLPPGVYKTSSTILINTLASNGQLIRGAGAVAFTGSGVGKSTIQPTAAVTAAFRIDGAPTTEVYIMGMCFEALAVDMTNMADLATSVAFEQHNAFDISYNRCRAYNYGLNKVSWHFQDGAFTTQMSNCGGGIVSFDGLTISNATTTITVTNCDILTVQHDSFQNITFVGGAIQKPYAAGMKILYLAPGKTPYALPVNTAGCYVAVMSEVNNSIAFSSIGTDWENGGGYPSTYNDGTHGVLNLFPVVMVDTNCINTTFINPTFAGCYLLDYGINTTLQGQPQSGVTGFDIMTGVQYRLNDLRVSGVLSGPVAFAGAVGSETSSSYTLNGATGVMVLKGQTIRPTADGAYSLQVNNAANTQAQLNFTTGATTGTLGIVGGVQPYNIRIQPATDGANIFNVLNTVNNQLVNLTTATVPANSVWSFANGIKTWWYSDGFVTIKASVDGLTGAAVFSSIGATSPGTGAFTTLSATGKATAKSVNVGLYTFATLPTSPADGDVAAISDSNSVVFNATAAGGGTSHMLVHYNGTAWVVG